jgi:hypothetical protein
METTRNMPVTFDPPYQHVVIVVEENHGLQQIIASDDAPVIRRLAREGLVFTRYTAIGHPSQPNYFALFSGSTHGVRDDGRYHFNAPTLAGQLRQAGYTFGGFAEAGSPRKHNPWESFQDSLDTGRDMSAFPSDFDHLPTVSIVVPDLMHDMHDGSIAEGDAWLGRTLGTYAEWAKTHHSLLVVTFDEPAGSGPVPTIIVGHGVKPGVSAKAVNHYSLLGLVEGIFGLPRLAEAATAPTIALVPD